MNRPRTSLDPGGYRHSVADAWDNSNPQAFLEHVIDPRAPVRERGTDAIDIPPHHD